MNLDVRFNIKNDYFCSTMNESNIPLEISNQVSPLILDYTNEKKATQPFYTYPNNLEGFKSKIQSTQFTKTQRALLVQQLKQQYATNNIPAPKRIDSLLNENTFVVTTGHQLCLFGGPQYFIHKIVSTIKLAQQLKDQFPTYNFLPLFWLASEDHDFEEISHAHIYRTTIQSTTDLKGAVGRMPMTIFKDSYQELFELLGDRVPPIQELFDVNFKSTTLAQATTKWVNQLFENTDLIILDGDDKALKRSFIPTIQKELENEDSFNTINSTSAKLKELGYKAQVTPRAINLFYLNNNLRERIVLDNKVYRVLNTDITFSSEEILEELSNHPERFSPNAVLRPVYQEAILPNLAYIGGPGELAYWLQLRSNFDQLNIPFPVLVLRDLIVTTDDKTLANIHKLNLKLEDFFLNEDDLIKKYLKNTPSTHLDFEIELNALLELKSRVLEKTQGVDHSLTGMVEAEFVKMRKGIERINQKTQKSIKQREEVALNKIKNIKQKITPNDKLAERKESFIPNYLQNPSQYIEKLIHISNPFISEIKVFKQ